MKEEKKGSKRSRSRAKIMHEAKKLYEQHGLGHVTFAQIADEAGMCRTTIFNHFSTSNELVMAIYEEEIEKIHERCQSTGLSGLPLLQKFFDLLIDDMVDYPVLATEIVSSAILNAHSYVGYVEGEVLASLPPSCGPIGSEERRLRGILIMGAYYGLINHYHINKEPFDGPKMKQEFRLLVDRIILEAEETETVRE